MTSLPTDKTELNRLAAELLGLEFEFDGIVWLTHNVHLHQQFHPCKSHDHARMLIDFGVEKWQQHFMFAYARHLRDIMMQKGGGVLMRPLATLLTKPDAYDKTRAAVAAILELQEASHESDQV